MTIYQILINVLVFCSILLLIALTVGSVYLIMILADVRRLTREVKEKILLVTSVFDIVSLFFGGIDRAKKKIQDRSTLTALVAGLKKGLETFLKK